MPWSRCSVIPAQMMRLCSRRSPIGRLAQGTVRDLFYDMREGVTVHGFRATFATWAHDARKYRDAAIEIALSHLDDDKVRAMYRRTDMLDERRDLMQDWSHFAVAR